MRRDDTMKFEEDFDFETANAQFHKDDIDKELQNKLKLKGEQWVKLSLHWTKQIVVVKACFFYDNTLR